KDVAGMVRSFGYAAYAALFAFGQYAPGDYQVLEQWADAWQHQVSATFINTYVASVTAGTSATSDAPALVPDQPAWHVLLRALELDKALYELAYEIDHRPEWVRIPLVGSPKL